MKKAASARFRIKSWDEKPYSEGEDLPKMTRASVAKTFTGDIDGEGHVEYVMIYRSDGTAAFVGLERITGRIAGRNGSFVLQRAGVLPFVTCEEPTSPTRCSAMCRRSSAFERSSAPGNSCPRRLGACGHVARVRPAVCHDGTTVDPAGAAGYNLLFRWFVCLTMDDPVWDSTTFTKNRDRLLNPEIARSFFRRVAERAKGLMSDEHLPSMGR
jgi:hypothetical protein